MKGRLSFAVTDLGPKKLKNIADPMRVYSLQVGVPAQAKPAKSLEPAIPKKACHRSARSPQGIAAES